MKRASIRVRVIREARRDAAAYYREFRGPAGPDIIDWARDAWADLMVDWMFTLDAAGELWSVYWVAFSEETVRLAR
jgi:hypothetical protein